MRNNLEILRMALDHILKKLSDQQVYLISLRNQAGISAAVSGLIATFFGTLIGDSKNVFVGDAFLGMSVLGLSAILCFGVSIACSAMVVVHFYEFTFSFNGERMLEKMEACDTEESFLRRFVEDGEWFFADNERLIGNLQQKLLFAMVFGFTQILPWLAIVLEKK